MFLIDDLENVDSLKEIDINSAFISKGFDVILHFNPILNTFLIFIKNDEKLFKLISTRDSVRTIKDPRRVIDWAKEIGAKHIIIEIDLAKV